MSTAASQLQFAAEFSLFLVALAGLSFALLRPEMLAENSTIRLGAAIGFGCLAVASFAHGALLVDAADASGLVALRTVGMLALAPLPLQWRSGTASRLLLWTSLVALAVSEVGILSSQGSAADWARAAGALALGAALLAAGRRSIPTRIAASSAAILLAVVLAIAVSLSVVISTNVEQEAKRRFGAESNAEAEQASAQGVLALNNAALVGRVIANTPASNAAFQALVAESTSADARNAARERLTSDLSELVVGAKDIDPRVGPVLIVGPTGGVLVATGITSNADAALFAGTSVVAEVLANGTQRQSLVVASGGIYGVGVRVLSLDNRTVNGAVIFTTLLDNTYLESRVTLAHTDIAGYGIALVGRNQILASTGPQPSDAALQHISAQVIEGADTASTTVDSRFVVAKAVVAPDGSRLAALIISVPATFLEGTRDDVFRALFLAALGATLLALVLASFVGERIGAGLRRLTVAAGQLQAGDLHASAGLRSDDELGVLSSSFDSMTGSIRGMTAELRQAAEDEAGLRGRLEAVVAGMAEAVVAVDDRGDVTDYNAAAAELFGMTARKAVGRPLVQIIDLVDSSGTPLTERLLRPGAESWTAPAAVIVANGTEVPVVVSAGTLRGAADQVVGAVFLFRDVRREQEVERMKTEFLANISHEMRSPLTPIKGYAGMLRTRTVSTDRVKQFATEIEGGVVQLERVVDQLVNFATMAAGRLDLHVEEIKVRELLDKALARWQDRLPKSVTLERKVARGVKTIAADRRYLEQSLDELIDNAVKYSPNGGKILVSAASVEGDEAPMVEIAVTDHGEGIAPAKLGTIFDDFSQGDASVTRRFGGLGLGLALASRIVRAHGGDLDCQSVVGKGTRVAIRIPIDHPGAT